MSSNNLNFKERLHKVIPGGAHTYSRGDDQYPENAPAILQRGKGAYVWDAHGNKYLDYGMGLRSVTLGYDYDEVSEAAFAEIRKGNNLTRASLSELEAAELMVSLFPSSDMVKFAKNGSTVTTAAVKLARAYTGRKYVAICKEQPFFTYDDWFIGTTPMDKGIPEEHKALSLGFHYNNIQSLQQLFDQYPNQIAAVILEPANHVSPCSSQCSNDTISELGCAACPYKTHNFLHQVQKLCRERNAVFILDEMISGFRWHLNGAQHYYGLDPDLSTFGKGMANGFALAALIGKREIMELGGILNEGEERVFLISTTHGSEMSAFGAFIKTVDVYKKEGVVEHLWDYGKQLILGANALAEKHGIQDYFSFEGYPCSPYYFTKDKDKQVSLPFRTLFSQEMIKRGILMPWVALSFAHKDEELRITLQAIDETLGVFKNALAEGIQHYLEGKSIKPVFRQYN